MSEVNWDDNAKAAAMEFACYIGKAKDCEKYFKHIAPKKTKTVEDAVEWAKGKLPKNSEWTHIRACKRLGAFFFADGNPDGNRWDSSDFICTREQFEACAAKKGEKWTHIDAFGDPCRILIEEKDDLGYVVILRQSGHYATPAASSLKPIKPTITKAQAWDKMCESEHEFDIVNRIKQMYDII